MSNPKIIIGYCTGGSPVEEYMESVIAFMGYDSNSRRCLTGLLPQKGLYIDLNRNVLARKALKAKWDYMVSLDDDIQFDQHVIYSLIDEAEKNDRAILGALYFAPIIDGKIRPVWFVRSEGNPQHNAVTNVGKFNTGTIVPLDAVGMGCTLIRRDVFEEMDRSELYTDTAWPYYGREPVTIDGQTIPQGEDLSLCLRARDLGLKTWGHAGIEVGHWKRIKLDFRLFRALYELDIREEGTY